MRKLLGKALIIAIAAVITAGATAALAGGLWGERANPGGSQGYQAYKRMPAASPQESQQVGSGSSANAGQEIEGRKRGGRIKGVIVSVGENELVVKTRIGELTVPIDGQTRVVEVRRGLDPVGAMEGQRVLLIGARDGESLKIKAVIIRADKATDAPAESRDDLTGI